MSSFDLIVIGGGPQGLAHAVRAAKAGARVKLIEARPQLGGRLGAGADWDGVLLPAFRSIATTEDITALRGLGLDPADLGWTPATRISAMDAAGEVLAFHPAPELSSRGLNTRAPFEADRWRAFAAAVARMAEALEIAQGMPAIPKSKALPLSGLMQALSLPRAALQTLMTLLARPLTDFMAAEISDPLSRAVLAGPALFQSALSPGDAGSLMAMIGAPLMDPTSERLDLGFVRERHTDATAVILSVLRHIGIDVALGVPVTEIKLERGKAAGVVMADGQTFLAPQITSSLDTKATVLGLMDWSALPPRLVRDIGAVKLRGVAGRVVAQLSETALPAVIQGAGPLYLDTEPALAAQAADAWHLDRIPDAPPMEIVATADGGGIMLSCMMHFLPQAPLGQPWTAAQQSALIESLKDALAPVWPGLGTTIKSWRFDGPGDFETQLGWSHGNPFGKSGSSAERLEGRGALEHQLCEAVEGLTLGARAGVVRP